MLFIESMASTASISDKDAVYLIESVVGGLHICKRVRFPTVCEGLQLTREDRSDHRFAVCLQVSLAGQTFAARGRDGGARERGKRTSGHYRQVFVDVAGMLAAPIRLEIV